MLTYTAIRACLPAIREAFFNAACQASESGAMDAHGKAYVANRHGQLFLRADVIRPDSGLTIFRLYGEESRSQLGAFAVAAGGRQFHYIQRLCDHLAAPATVKHW